MLCYTPPPTDAELFDAFLSTLPEKVRKIQKDNDELTDLLCTLGKCMVNKTPIPANVLKWWGDHRKWDEDRGERWDK